MSPKLFTTVLVNASKIINWRNRGLKTHGEFLYHFRLADVISVFADTKEQLTSMDILVSTSTHPNSLLYRKLQIVHFTQTLFNTKVQSRFCPADTSVVVVSVYRGMPYL